MSANASRVALLCLVVALVTACSGEPERPDRGEKEGRPAVTESVVEQYPEATEFTGYEEHTVEGMTLRREASVLSVEARLQRGEDENADEILVRATVNGTADYRDCTVLRASDWFDLGQAIRNDRLPDEPAPLQSRWAREAERERYNIGGEFVVVYREDGQAEGGVADSRENAYYALCFMAAEGGEYDGQITYYYAAHVEGTPDATEGSSGAPASSGT